MDIRSALLVGVKEEARDDKLLSFVWSEWSNKVAKAERAIAEVVAENGGMATTMVLANLYQQQPWLISTVAGLRDFCAKSRQLVYLPRSRAHGTRAMVCLQSALQTVDEEGEPEEELYVPHWLSRKVLNAQLRSGRRSTPRGFNRRCNSERKRKQRQWVHDFLCCFWPQDAHHVDSLIKATRRWPGNDCKNDCARAAFAPTSGQGNGCSSCGEGEAFVEQCLDFNAYPTVSLKLCYWCPWNTENLLCEMFIPRGFHAGRGSCAATSRRSRAVGVGSMYRSASNCCSPVVVVIRAAERAPVDKQPGNSTFVRALIGDHSFFSRNALHTS